MQLKIKKTRGEKTQRGIFGIGRLAAYIFVIATINPLLGGVSARSLHFHRGLAMPCKSEKADICDKKMSLLGRLRGGDNPVIAAFRQVSQDIAESKTSSWIALIAVIVNGCGAATLSKMASEKDDSIYLATSLVLYNISMLGFNLCLKQIDVSIAYAVWSALGTIIVTLAGVTMFGETINVTKVLCLLLIVAGVVGLNVIEG